MIELGQKGRDKVTGFEGIVTGHARYLHGQDRYGLEAPAREGRMGEMQWFEASRIEQAPAEETAN